ncbi:hypothetical protein Nepgr_029331 [Nepenthes gracilis]|uniref:Uncharacterized protein n=1 Tax=Nepenthes gracilis TaxID=150966 RepID=A0AAD3TE08_NEPGR|nr:hypothetical protein Nepgr_029331 [Nepenthes gracilis]
MTSSSTSPNLLLPTRQLQKNQSLGLVGAPHQGNILPDQRSPQCDKGNIYVNQWVHSHTWPASYQHSVPKELKFRASGGPTR